MTYNDIIRTEPRISIIIDSLRPARGNAPYLKYVEVKKKIEPLVGWYAAKEAISSSHAYDIIIEKVIEKLRI